MEIEKSVPIRRKGYGRPTVYPWGKMEVGDSFLVPAERRSAVSVAAGARGRTWGEKYITRAEGAKVRCWRVE